MTSATPQQQLRDPIPSTSRATATEAATTASPLRIPEVLDHIFSYVDNHSLCQSVILVCRQWFWMNRHRVIRGLIFDGHSDPRKLNKVLTRLPGAGRLCWFTGRDVSRDAHWVQLRKVLKRNHDQFLQNQIRQYQHVDQSSSSDEELQEDSITKRLLTDSPLRELEIIGDIDIGASLPPILPCLYALTRLQLELSCDTTLQMGQLLKACPLLKDIHVSALSTHCLELPGPWFPFVKDSHKQRPLRLLSLVLERVRLPQYSLEDLLSITPYLQELKVIGLLKVNPSLPQHEPTVQYDPTRFFQHVRSLELPLRSFHFSIRDQPLTTSELREMMFDIVRLPPGSRGEWAFWTADLTPPMLRNLNEVPNVVTTLEIFCETIANCSPDSGLHRYLCASPHLMHLRAPKTAYLVEHLDLHQRLRGRYLPAAGTTQSVRPGIWKCRNLQTLHLAFHSRRDSTLSSPTNARLIFGYLARVCPQLRDLAIFTTESCMLNNRIYAPVLHMRLQGGFCLLARLKWLERLRIGSSERLIAYKSWDLKWMVTNKHSFMDRRQRRKIVGEWDELLVEEEKQEVLRIQTHGQSGSHDDTSIATSAARLKEDEGMAEVRKELDNLGLLVDVKTMMEEMDSDDFQCWKSLRKISLYRDGEVGLRPEQEIQRLIS
ncbi:hypothetical protein K457DRAFT_133447 [Linnemannia elongata AG-77]|uniref:F-box domain-containing protein n=1 Tax=Linnemannia elongata AG-77 TaxID=1314771 RepID=A0A197KCK0_9FUNG|nr:hypothetical protein K457DRAFT_133447 [Linnemannia elongata AG-77]